MAATTNQKETRNSVVIMNDKRMSFINSGGSRRGFRVQLRNHEMVNSGLKTRLDAASTSHDGFDSSLDFEVNV
jgi:hypothetical protein